MKVTLFHCLFTFSPSYVLDLVLGPLNIHMKNPTCNLQKLVGIVPCWSFNHLSNNSIYKTSLLFFNLWKPCHHFKILLPLHDNAKLCCKSMFSLQCFVWNLSIVTSKGSKERQNEVNCWRWTIMSEGHRSLCW